MSRRRSIYRLPKLKLRQKTITALGSLIAFTLAVVSGISLATNSQTLSFWKEFLTKFLGWTAIISPLIFLLSGLSLTRARWKIAQTNVLLGLLLIVLSISGLTG